LYLRPGQYRLNVVDKNGRALNTGTINVTAVDGRVSAQRQAQPAAACTGPAGVPAPNRPTCAANNAND
jgi:hypothetical protein